MSAIKFKKQFLLLPLIVALLIGAFALLQPSAKERVAELSQETAPQESILTTAELPVKAEVVADVHPADCLHCVGANSPKSNRVENVLLTQPSIDYIFKGIASNGKVFVPRSTFDVFKGAELGRLVSIDLGSVQLSGIVSAVVEDPLASYYSLKLDGDVGRVLVDLDGHGMLSAKVLFYGDSRALSLSDHPYRSDEAMLLVEEKTISDLYCAPKDTIYTKNGIQPARSASNLEILVKEYAPLVGIAEAIALNSLPGAEYVIYCDFDGEVVTDSRWTDDVISALPHPKANDDEFVTAVWKRVSEDFAPFDITVTTDVSVYNATDVDKRLHVIVTPTKDAAPTAGGVAFLFSFRSNSPIVWVFNQSEYSCATTISHEAGHAFGLFHDGDSTQQYYPGHNSGFTPGWAPIMGAGFSDSFYDEVDSWSIGEYAGANNQEDDIAIIAGSRNGFGFKADDYADTIGGATGNLATTGLNQVGGSGLISRASDIDVFRLSSDDGQITLTVSPKDVESTDSQPGSNTQGANLAVQIKLLNESGVLVATGVIDGATGLGASVQATVQAGIYFLTVEGAGRGANATVGFSDYASLGEYTIVGSLPIPPLAVFGSQPTYTEYPPTGELTQNGYGKLDQAVLLGSTSTQVSNGTDFGFSFPGNSVVKRQFLLKNIGVTEITDISVSLASGADFSVVNLSRTTIGSAGGIYLTIGYSPSDSGVNGIDSDTVIINYDSGDSEFFEFTVSGTSTPSKTKDNYEINTSWDVAYSLNDREDVWLSDLAGLAFFRSSYRDFYTFNVETNELITIETAYDGSDGPITFELLNGSFFSLGTSVSLDGTIQFRVPDNYTAAQRKFYVRVSIPVGSLSGVYNAYDLRWSSLTLGGGDDDLYEDNNTKDQAFDLTGAFSPRLSEYLGEGISKDDDWYKITIPSNPYYRMLYVEATFVNADGNIDIEVQDESGSAIFRFRNSFPTTSATDNDKEVVTIAQEVFLEDYVGDDRLPLLTNYSMGLVPGTYYVHVSGDFAGNSYDLIVTPLMDDNYEIVDIDGTENDSAANAYNLDDTIIDTWLSDINGAGALARYTSDPDDLSATFVTLGDSDWYEFTVRSDEPVQQLVFEYTSVGISPLVSLIDADNGEVLSNLLRNEGVLVIDRPASSRFLVEVRSFDVFDHLTGYDFRVTLLTDLPFDEGAVEDNYEENDNFRELYNLTNNEGFWLAGVDGYGTQLDPDWYQISIPQGARQVIVQLVSDSSVGNVDLSISRKDGSRIFLSDNGGDLEEIIWDYPPAGEYALTVTGDRVGNQYNLFWDVVLEDDNYEENDELADAYDLTGQERIWLRKVEGPGVQRDQDWYKINVPSNTAELQLRTNFNPLAGDIDLELFDAQGYLIDRSISTSSIESITMASPPSGDYYLQLHYGNEGNEYDLWWAAYTQVELDAMVEDAYEQNNSFRGGYVLTDDQVWFSDLLGLATQTNDDWYEITIAEDNLGLDVDVTFTHADGDIDLEVYDDFGSVVYRSETLSDNESINYPSPLASGTYHIRVYGSNVGNEYDLYWVDRNEDIYEQNDKRGEAYDLSANKQFHISSIGVPTQGDDDWYLITADAASTLIAVAIDYVHANGNIDLELYSSSGSVISSSITTADFEYLQVAVSAGNYYIRVFGDNLYNDYDLIWNSDPDDGFEDNDTFFTATDLTLNAGDAQTALQFDDDWYIVETSVGEVRLNVDLTFTHTEGDINFEIYDASENLLVTVDSTDDNESITYGSDPAGATYYIRVYGDDLGNEYDLTWASYVQDAYEEKDNYFEAYDLIDLESIFLSDFEGHGSLLDEDWYLIEHTDADLLIEAVFTDGAGNIDVELFQVQGDGALLRVAGGTSDTDDEIILFSGPTGLYYIKVFGELLGNTYDLVWNSFTDDNYDDNDTAAGAASLDAVELQVIPALVQFDDDWYTLTVAPGDDVLLIECLFQHIEGNLNLELFSDAGITPVLGGSATSETDNETLSFSGLPTGVYYLHVSGRNIGTDYTLRWNSASEDSYEVNNDGANAADLNSEFGNTVIGAAFDDDWYYIDLPVGSNYLFVDLTNVVGRGDLTLSVYNAFEELLEESATTDDDESLDLAGLVGGRYYIKVSGDTFGNDYGLLCRSFQDDFYEENDEFANAYDFTEDPGVLLSVAHGTPAVELDDDYYRIVTPKDATHLTVDLTFTHADGNLALGILDSVGVSIATVNSADDDETLSISVSAQAQFYYVHVSGPISGNTYDLKWSTDNVDDYEVNDTGDLTAFDVSSINGSGTLSSLDTDNNGHGTQEGDDWYQFTVPTGQVRFELELSFIHEDGNIDVELLDSALNSIATAATTESVEVIDTPIDPTGTQFYIHITGDNLSNSYDFTFSTTDIDAYEVNNFIEQAHNLSGSEGMWIDEVEGYATQFDDDWYQIVVSDSSVTLSVECEFSNADGDIDIELYRLVVVSDLEDEGSGYEQRRPKLIERQQTTTDNESIAYDVTGAAGIYYIRAYQENAGNPYRLRWDDGVIDTVGDQVYLDEVWEFGYMATAALNSAPADINQNGDGDRYPNWAEYALGLDEDSYDQAIVSQYTGLVDGVSYYFVEYVRTKEAVIRGYQYNVEESYNLLFSGSAATYVGIVDISEDVEKVVYRSSLPVTEADSCFFRLEVESPTKGH